MTIFIVGIIGIIFLLLTIAVIVNIVLLAIGVIKLRKDKIASIAFISFAILNMMAILIGGYFLIGPKKVSVDTPDGLVKLWSNVIEDYLVNVGNDDLEEVEDMLKEEPKLVYCYDDDGEDILQKAALNGNVKMLKLALEYGAEFDSKIIFEESKYESSIQAFVDEIGKRPKAYDFADEKVYEIVEFMLENGATVELIDEDAPNVLFYLTGWICQDKIISDEDIELVKLLHLNGASYSYELYFEYVETTSKEMVDKDDNYEKLLDLVDGE